MIEVKNLTKCYHTRHGEIKVLDDINFVVKPHEKIGILGRNGAGKSTLIRLLSGVESFSHGTITRGMSVSWPLAFSGGFQGTLTGLDNLKFIARVYGTTWEDKVDYIQDFSELGRFFREPIKTYSSGMRARLAFALSMAIEFDCFLIDEVIAVGDSRFHKKCQIELFEKRADRAMILVSHSPEVIKAHCDKACVLKAGKLFEFETTDQAYQFLNA